jgi:Rrf2 family protein
MVDLASRADQCPIQRVTIAERQEISDQYLAQLFARLRRAGLIKSTRGPGGGYTLALSADRITAGDVLRAVEEKLEPVFCVEDDPQTSCPRVSDCSTHELWTRLGVAINHVLDSVTLADLCQDTHPAP